MERGDRLQDILLISQKPHPSGSTVKEPSLKVLSMESLLNRCHTTRALLHSSIKVPVIGAPTPQNTKFPSDGNEFPWREMSTSGDFPNIADRIHCEGSPPRPPPRSLFWEREMFHINSPLRPSTSLPIRGSYGKSCPSPEPILHILQGSQQGSPPSRFLSQSSHWEGHSTSRAPFNQLSKSPVDKLTPVCPAEPQWREMPIPRALFSRPLGTSPSDSSLCYPFLHKQQGNVDSVIPALVNFIGCCGEETTLPSVCLFHPQTRKI